MKNQMFTDGFQMIRDADVEVFSDRTPRSNKPVVRIVIAGQHEYQFSPESRVSRALSHSGTESIQKRMQGGNFFLHNGDLVNFQYGDQPGFVHTDDAIQALIDHVGYSAKVPNSVARNRLQSHNIRLQKVHSNTEIVIPAYQDGGNLNSQLSFTWDPFQSFVGTSFELVRLICENGMTGLTSFFNKKIPMVNEWREHLDIANKQIQNGVSSMIVSRMEEMARMPASVRDCQRVVDTCRSRLDSAPLNHDDQKALRVLKNNAYIAEPTFHLKDHYNENAFNDRRMTDQLSSHLSMFTVWNMLTEIASHTHVGEGETNFAVQKHANEMVFDRISKMKSSAQIGSFKMNPVFNNTEAALVGDQL